MTLKAACRLRDDLPCGGCACTRVRRRCRGARPAERFGVRVSFGRTHVMHAVSEGRAQPSHAACACQPPHASRAPD